MRPEALLSSDHGEASLYLEQTASRRWLAPWFRRLMDWSETSGYGALEADRADRYILSASARLS